MKFLIAFLLTALLSFLLTPYFPWWIIAVVAFIVAAAIPQNIILSFLSGSLALFFLWGIQAYFIDSRNSHILASKIAQLFIHRNSYLLVIFITAFIGGTTSGFAALSGRLFRKLFETSRLTRS